MDTSWLNTGNSLQGFEWQGGETVAPGTERRAEAIIGPQNFKQIWWLEQALQAARSVARVKLANGSATGFMVAPDIFMTNNHVFENADNARQAELQFNYRMLADDTLAPRDSWKCDPDSLFTTNPELDYTLVKVLPKDGINAGDTWGFHDLKSGARIFENNRVNIIQHPQGRFQEIAFRDNQVKHVDDASIQYLTDTDYGTSGAPVFDDFFNVVALHNQRVPDPNNPGRWYRNQGYRVEAITQDAGNLLP